MQQRKEKDQAKKAFVSKQIASQIIERDVKVKKNVIKQIT